MKDLNQKGYTTAEIMAALRMEQGARELRFRYDLLDENENKISELEEVESGEINFSSASDIKRTAKFSLREEMAPNPDNPDIMEPKVNYLKHRIQPFIELKLPDRLETRVIVEEPQLEFYWDKTLGEL